VEELYGDIASENLTLHQEMTLAGARGAGGILDIAKDAREEKAGFIKQVAARYAKQDAVSGQGIAERLGMSITSTSEFAMMGQLYKSMDGLDYDSPEAVAEFKEKFMDMRVNKTFQDQVAANVYGSGVKKTSSTDTVEKETYRGSEATQKTAQNTDEMVILLRTIAGRGGKGASKEDYYGMGVIEYDG